MKLFHVILFIFSLTCSIAQADFKKLNEKVSIINNVKNIPASDIDEYYGGKSKNNQLLKIGNKTLTHKEVILNKCQQDEIEFSKVEFNLISKLEALLEGKNSNSNKIFSNTKFLGFDYESFENPKVQTANSFLSHSIIGKSKSIKKKASYIELTKSFSSINFLNISPYRIISHRPQRDPKSLNMKTAKVLAWLDVRGSNKGIRKQQRVNLEILIKKTDSNWKALEVKLNSGKELVAKRKPIFSNVTASSGFDEVPIYQRSEAIRRGGYAISVGDYDNDKNLDVFIGAYKNSSIFKGKKDGTFSPVKIKGLPETTLVKSAVWADFNNDGHEDLFLARFVPEFIGPKNKTYTDLLLFTNDKKGGFKKVSTPFAREYQSSNAMPSSVADFNKDGLLDIYVGFPGSLDFTFIGNADSAYQKFSKQGLFINNGEMDFSDIAPKKLPGSITNSQSQGIYPHSSLAVDFDEDGDMDLIVLDDRGNLSPIYKNNGSADFLEVVDYTGIVNKDFAMGVSSGDFDNDGILDFVLTNVNFLSSRRMRESCNANWHTNFDLIGVEGIKLFKGTKSGKFLDVTKTSGLDWAGEGAAGVEFIDYDNDGLLDIYVANGLWTGTKGAGDISSLFIRDTHKNDMNFIDEIKAGQTKSEYMEILTDFTGKFDGSKITKGKSGKLSLAGFQRNRLFKNMGNGQFEDVAYLEGVDSEADGYIMAIADINKDGKMDLFLRNGDPGVPQVTYPSVEVFLNDPKNISKNKSLLVHVKESKNGRYSSGAFVEAKFNGKVIKRHLVENNGTSQSQKVLHFGLDKSSKVDELIVRWPNGTKKVLRNVEAGSIEVFKDKSIKISFQKN